MPPADLLLIDKRAEHEHDERLDVVGHAALEDLPALDGPEVDDPVAAHEQRRGNLAAQKRLVAEGGLQLGELSLQLQQDHHADGRPEHTARHEEKRIDLAA